jgi:hypothetical protein
VGAALTKPGRAGTARRRGLGERDGKVYARNQCLTPLNGPPAQIWRIWAGRGAHPSPWAAGNSRWGCGKPSGGHGECLRRSRGDAAGVELGASPVDRLRVNVGTVRRRPRFTCPAWGRAGASSADGVGRGGGFVVVGGRESRSHGEGSQQVCSGRAGMPGGRW